MKNTIGFIGAGNMGSAIIRGMLSEDSPTEASITVADPSEAALKALAEEFPTIRTATDNGKAAASSILVLAVKPQVYKPVIRDIRNTVSPDTVIVTIAAGITIETVNQWFGGNRKIIRTMPNTPALVGEGMTALCPGPGITETEMIAVTGRFRSRR